MPFSRKTWKRLGVVLAAAVVLLAVVRTWVVPALIVRTLQRELAVRATIRDWWLNGRSGGVVGLVLHDGAGADAAVLATAERVATDLSLWSLVRGRWTPRRIEIEQSEVRLRVDRDGRILNLPALPGRGAARQPAIAADVSRVVLQGEGSAEPMVVSRVAVTLTPDSSGRSLTLSGGADDPTWGRWTASGSIDPVGNRGLVQLAGARVEADPRALACVPFVPAEVWTHVVPRGPVRVEVRLDWDKGRTPEFGTSTEVTLLGASARFPTLGLAADETTGTLHVEGGRVRAEQVRGRALGGEVSGGGTLDFEKTPPRIELALDLNRIKVEATPKLWQLDKAGITGLLTGTVALRAQLHPSGVDLSGSTGDATVENASIQGIPVKSLHLAMHAEGNALEYDAGTPGSSKLDRGHGLKPLARSIFGTHLAWWAWGPLIALQPPAEPTSPPASAPAPAPPAEEPRGFRVRLPSTVSTELELEDVELSQLIAKAQAVAGFPFPIPITGKLSLKAKATIPLGAMSDLKQYVFHGDAVLKQASLFRLDVALLTARLDLENGLLELKRVRGLLVDRPDGGPDNPPRIEVAEAPDEGPLPAGGFRGELRAELAPLGAFKGRFEGTLLPLGELAAPLLPRPTPLAGLASFDVEAQGDLARAGDPTAWTASGRAESLHLTYDDAALERVELRFELKDGRLSLPRLTALLDGRPLSAEGGLDLKPPQAYRATLKVDGWDLAKLLALAPQLPRDLPAAGVLNLEAEAHGALSPWTLTTEGRGRIDRFEAASVALGTVPFHWSTDRDSIWISDVEARPFGGRFTAEAHIPVAGGGAAEGTALIRGLDTARLSAVVPGGDLKLTGIAEGSVAFVVPADGSGVQANVRINSRDLTFQGIPAEQVRASIRTDQGALKYDVTADSLGGKLKLRGEVPLSMVRPPNQVKVANGELQFLGFAVEQLWRSLAAQGAPDQAPAAISAPVVGQGVVDANLRHVLAGAGQGLWAHGIVELRDLKLKQGEPVGRLRGVVARSPTVWRVDPIQGELLGGATNGLIWGSTPSEATPDVGFRLRLERATLPRLLQFAPGWSSYVDGLGSLQITGKFNDALRADLGLNVEQARVVGLPVSELRIPATLVFSPTSGAGSLRLRQSFARISGGVVRGDALFRIGADRSFEGQVQLADIDLNMLNRLSTDSSRLATGRISGRISLLGSDPSQPEHYRGRVNLDLDDASLFSIPIFREIEKFFGATRGGLFEDGDMVAAIGNRQLMIESFSLEGKLVQLHMTGTVGFDSQLNLEVLVNTTQLIPETGQLLLSRIPGLKEVLGRSDQALVRVSRFLSNRLVKLRVTGTLRNPAVAIDPSVVVVDAAAVFFSSVLGLPIGLGR